MKIKNVWGPDGYGYGPANSMVGKGETIVNFDTGDSSMVTTGKVGVDSEYSSVTRDDNNVILGNDPNLMRYNRGKNIPTYAQMAAPITMMRQVLKSRIDSIDALRGQRMSLIESKSGASSLSRKTAEVTNREFDRLKSPLLQLDSYLELQHKQLADEQRALHMLLANCGKDRFDGGADIPIWLRLIPSVAGTTASALLLLRWAKEPVRRTDTYAASPFSSLALRTLSGLRLNPYSMQKAATDAERRSAYALSQQGMTGGRRDVGRVALGIGAMQNAAAIDSQTQQQNNALAAQAANAYLQEGNAIAGRRLSASQFDRQDYVAAHGRKTKGIETATANLINQINSAYQNEFKYNTWRDTIGMYNQQLSNEQQNRVAEIEDRAKQRRLEQLRIDALKKKPIGNVYGAPYLSNNFLYNTGRLDPGNFWKKAPRSLYGG